MSADNSEPDDHIVNLWNRYQDAVAKESFNEADDTILNILNYASEWCEENDDSEDLALLQIACACEENGDWLGAEKAYREMLTLPDRGSFIEHTAHRSLASLYGILNREAESLFESELQVAVARDTDTPILLAVSLVSHARRLMQSGQIADAETPIAEALQVADRDEMYGQIKASALTTRAECAVRKGNLDSAATDLTEAYRLLESQSSIMFAAGVQGDLIRWWSATARLRLAQGQLEQSLASWDEALTRARQMAELPHVDSVCGAKTISTVLEGYAEATSQTGRDAQAEEMHTEAKRLLQQVGLPMGRFNQKLARES